MDEFELLISSMTKQELVSVIKHFNIYVEGFQRRKELASEKILLGSLHSALKDGILGKKRKGKCTPVLPDDVMKFLFKKIKVKIPGVINFEVEDIVRETEENMEFLPCYALSVLFTRFPEIYTEWKPILIQNKRENKFLFNGLTKAVERSTIEKIYGTVRSSYRMKEDIKPLLTGYYKEKKEKDPNLFNKLDHYVQDDEVFLKTLRIIKENQLELILAFLLKGNRYDDPDYFPLVIHLLNSLNARTTKNLSESKKEWETEEKHLRREIKEFEKRYQKLQREYHELKKSERLLLKLKPIYEVLKREKKKIEVEVKQHHSFMSYFTDLFKKHNILFVTRYPKLYLNTPLEPFIYTYEEIMIDKNRKDVSRLKGKHVFITRVSWKSSNDWNSITQFLYKQKIMYTEVLGYDINEQLDDLLQELYREENISYEHHS